MMKAGSKRPQGNQFLSAYIPSSIVIVQNCENRELPTIHLTLNFIDKSYRVLEAP